MNLFPLNLMFIIATGINGLQLTEIIHRTQINGLLKSGSDDWDILKLTQSWPPALCIYAENEGKDCKVPSNITTWVIHGLWPTKTGTEGPNYCNSTWKFDIKQVQPLRPRLDLNWPSITMESSPYESWKHEWEKHGTCASLLPALKGEIRYFNVTLSLHFHFDLSQALKQGGVIASDDRKYKPENVLTVLQQALGAVPSITCVKSEDDDQFYLEQVELCLSKSFKPVDCEYKDSRSTFDLTFQSEMALQEGKVKAGQGLRGNLPIHNCGVDGIYYKPLPSYI